MTEACVLVIGEALVDIVVSAEGRTEHPGGSPANVALGLGRRGRDVALLTRLGRDPHASRIVRHLERSGVTVLAESFTSAPTSTALATLHGDGSARYEFDIEWDLPPVPPHVEPALLHTGSLGAFLEPGASKLLRYLEETPAAAISFDPNIRPDLIRDHSAAVEQFEAIAERSTIVKLSDEDAGWLYPDLSIREALGRIRAIGPRLVAATLGADGALLRSASESVDVPGVLTPIADTIGAGDTFMTSLIDDYLTYQGELDTERLSLLGVRAATAAAITVSRPGADLPWARELGGTHSAASHGE
ncbi:carbohydrate kinase family protein [Microbacterium stercoris]|uniref:Carbohydrate kinase n=1 Tax=Microbacterium stercoris TaxID=2820289 RepID=A0A939QQJ0_9MICO|nr:carbohydrate kinase [Microbacterium stercoris]MBO3662816.1 carbohydrate kinase [Microbacterium stercoris]